MKLKLISYKLCPYVQRALTIVGEKRVSVPVEYIDLANKPQWFLERSPRGKVPILIVDDEETLFESHAICEFIDEVYPKARMMPADPLERARDRAWFAYMGEVLLAPLHALEFSPDEDKVREAYDKLRTGLGRLEGEMQDRKFLSGDGSSFGMADVGIGSFFYRAAREKKAGGVDLLDGFTHLQEWSGRVLARASVQSSVPEDFPELAVAAQEDRGSWLLQNAGVLGT